MATNKDFKIKNGLITGSHIKPNTDGSIDLGVTGTNKFRDLFLKGKIDLQSGSGSNNAIFFFNNSVKNGWLGIPAWDNTSFKIYVPSPTTGNTNEPGLSYKDGAWSFFTDFNNTSGSGSTSPALFVSTGGSFNVLRGNIQVGSTTVISSARNLENIGTISSGNITTSGFVQSNSSTGFTANGSDVILRAIAPGIESGHTTKHEMTYGWSASSDRTYQAPKIDGTANFNDEFGYDFANENWYFEDLLSIGSISSGAITTSGNVDINSDAGQLQFGADNDMQIFHNGANGEINIATGSFTIDSPETITLNADQSGRVLLSDGATNYGRFQKGGTSWNFHQLVTDHSFRFLGNVGGTETELLKLDSANSGFATFSNGASFTNDVGIGLSAPATKLHIQDATNPVLRVEDTTNNVKTDIGATDTQGYIGTNTDHPFIVRYNDTPSLRFDSFKQMYHGTDNTNAENLWIGGNVARYQYLDTRDYMRRKGHHASSGFVVFLNGSGHRVTPYMDNTNIYINGTLHISNADAYEIQEIQSSDLSTFDVITADKPIVVAPNQPRNFCSPISFGGHILAGFSTRNYPIIFRLFAPYSKVDVEIYKNSSNAVDISGTPSYTGTIEAGGGLNITESGASGTNYWIIKATGYIVGMQSPTGGDNILLPPIGQEVLSNAQATNVIKINDGTNTSQTTSTNNNGAYYYRENSGDRELGIGAFGTADGAGGDAEFGAPLEFLSDYYIYPQSDITNFRLASYTANKIQVLDKDGNRLYTIDHSNATKEVPQFHEEGSSSGNGSPLNSNGAFRFIGTSPFHLVCQSTSDYECVQLGALQSELDNVQAFQGGYIQNGLTVNGSLSSGAITSSGGFTATTGGIHVADGVTFGQGDHFLGDEGGQNDSETLLLRNGASTSGNSGIKILAGYNDGGDTSGKIQLYTNGSTTTPKLEIDIDGNIKMGTTQIISSGRNLTNIGTISSGAITSSQNININASGTNTTNFEVGANTTANHYSYIDLISDTTYSDYGLRIIRNNTGANSSAFIYHRGTGNFNIETQESASIRLRTAGTDALTLDSSQNATFTGSITASGNVNIDSSSAINMDFGSGVTSDIIAGSGTTTVKFGGISTNDDVTAQLVAFGENGIFEVGDGEATLQGSHGELLHFKTSSTTLEGAIGSRSESSYNLFMEAGSGTSAVGFKVHTSFGSHYISPSQDQGATADNMLRLGFTTNRYKELYAVDGSINTSDINEKQDIQELTDAEQRVALACKGLIRRYKWNHAVVEKGEDARYHIGIMAQDLQQAFTDEGLDASKYGLFTSDTWENEDGTEQTRLGVRYNELLAFIISAI